MMAERISFTFRKSDRLLKSSEFRVVMKEGRRFHTKNLIFFLKKGGRGSRLGIIVTKRFGKATRRNRAKRIIREVWRHKSPFFSEPCEAVIVVKNDAGTFNFKECGDDFRNALERYRKSEAENS